MDKDSFILFCKVLLADQGIQYDHIDWEKFYVDFKPERWKEDDKKK